MKGFTNRKVKHISNRQPFNMAFRSKDKAYNIIIIVKGGKSV